MIVKITQTFLALTKLTNMRLMIHHVYRKTRYKILMALLYLHWSIYILSLDSLKTNSIKLAGYKVELYDQGNPA